MQQSGIRKQIFLIFFLALFLLVARLYYPFMTIILWSCLLYVFIEPLFDKITSRMRPASGSGRKRTIGKTLVAGAFAILAVLLVIVPFIYLIIALMKQMVDLSTHLVRFVETNPDLFTLKPSSPLGGFVDRVSGGQLDLSNVDLIQELKAFLSASSTRIIGYSGRLLKNAASLVMTLAFMVFTLFFMLLDGKALITTIISAVPIERSYTSMFMEKMRKSGKQLVLGYFLVALYQGTAMYIICLIFGMKNELVLATLTAIASFIPMVGTALVWIPASAYLGLTEGVGRAILFMVSSGLFVAFADNFLRSKVLGERLAIHPLLIFFAIAGGLKLFGVNGLVLGPLILIIFFSAVELYDAIDAGNSGRRERTERKPE